MEATSLVALALLLAPAARPAVQEDEPPKEIEYETHAQSFLEAHDASGARPGSLSLAALLDDASRYRRIDVGLFDLRFPREALEERSEAKKLAEAALAVVGVQREWYRWCAPEGEESERVLEAFETLTEWIEDWRAARLVSFAKSDEPDFLEDLNASSAEREAHALVEDVMARGAYLGLHLPEDPTTQILLAPDRKTFLETLCFAGWNAPTQRYAYWKPGVEKWTSVWADETQVVALTYPGFPIDPESPFRDAPMDEYEKTGLGQHTAEKAAVSMFWRYFGDNDALFYEAAVATELAIAVFGESNVRTGAAVFKSSGGATQAYSVFVPGGASSGGTLGGRGAVSIIYSPLWRKNKGEEHFVEPLQDGQEDGHELAREAEDEREDDELAHFRLRGENVNDKTYVSAPFFGPHAKDKALPEETFLEDYEEFFRAYRASFFHWLRTRGGGDEERSEMLFTRLNHELATRPKDEPFHEVVARVYDVPLSGADGTTDSLEWRFLAWIEGGGRG